MLPPLISFLALASMASGLVCTPSGIELALNSTDNANPLYVDPATGLTFHKYDTDVGSATEAEMNTVEYICSYDVDDNGIVWLVSEQGQGVARMTPKYVEHFADFDTSPTDRGYEYSSEVFEAALQEARADPDLQAAAQAWVDEVKWTPEKAAAAALEPRYLYRCGPSRCQSQRSCVSYASYCNVCRSFVCYYLFTPIVDAC